MSGVQKCRLTMRQTSMTDFGLERAAIWFGLSPTQVEELAGRFTKGKRKGQLRGWIVWIKCEEGGWYFGGNNYPSGVIRPGTTWAAFCLTYDEMAGKLSQTAGQFMSQQHRVDSTYGNQPNSAELRSYIYAAKEQAVAKKHQPR